MDTFRRIWDFLTSVGAFFFLPAICAVFSGLIVYILPDWAVLRYPLMVVLIVLSGLMSWKASEIGLQDMLQKGHIDGVKPWMRYFCYLIGVAGVACTAYVMYAFAMSEKKKNAPRPATVYVVRGDEFSRVRVEVTDTAYTVSDADRVLSFMPESDSCYVANLTADTLVVYREFYGRAKVWSREGEGSPGLGGCTRHVCRDPSPRRSWLFQCSERQDCAPRAHQTVRCSRSRG